MKTKYLLFICLVVSTVSCKKFLDKAPNKSLIILHTLAEAQSLMDDYINVISEPYTQEISADDYYMTTPDFLSLNAEANRRAYTWEPDYLFGNTTATEWYNSYQLVYRANTVLELMEKVERNSANAAEWDNVKGQALFLRARVFLAIINTWTIGYDAKTAGTALGIPLRVGTDFNKASTRSSLEESYQFVIQDLKSAVTLLPNQPLHAFRSSKPAALGLLARTLLFMRDYDNCFTYADQYLELKTELLDYNTLSATATYPVPEFSKEVIYTSALPTAQPLALARGKVDSLLIKMYREGDLRKQIFFRDNKNGTYGFKGSYHGSLYLFSGIATDEVYLMRAECYARKGGIKEALDDLNTLLKYRWTNTKAFIPLESGDQQETLKIILQERRKELLFRGLRWPDLKRLNIEGANITLTRNINSQTYTLKPNDLRYALPIPEGIIDLTGMPQNPR